MSRLTFASALLALPTMLGCYAAHEPEQVATGTLFGRFGHLHLDPIARRFEYVERRSVFACSGDVDERMAALWSETIDHLLHAPAERIDPFGSCVAFRPDAGGRSTCRVDVVSDAMTLSEMARAAAVSCALAAPPDVGLVRLPDATISVSSDGSAYRGELDEPCGSLGSSEAARLLVELADESRDALAPVDMPSAEVYLVDDPRWGDLGGRPFVPPDALVIELREAVEGACGS